MNPYAAAVRANDLKQFRELISVAQPDLAGIAVALTDAAFPHRRTEYLSAYLQARLDSNVSKHDGTTLLMWAAYWGDVDSVRQLIEAGAALNLKDPDGRSAMIYGIAGGRVEVVQALADAGADLEAIDRDGKTVSDYAALVGVNTRLPLGMQLSTHRSDPNNPIARWIDARRRDLKAAQAKS